MAKDPVIRDAHQSLRQVTTARIGLGRAGDSLPTAEWLAFKRAHAAARDAVHETMDAQSLAAAIGSLGPATIQVNSRVRDRSTYLRRPDLGRTLDDPSAKALRALTGVPKQCLALIVSDGLSAIAVMRQAVPLIEVLLPRLDEAKFALAPIVIASFGRVALQDEIGELLGAQLSLMLIGERPGLGSPDSLGAYLTYHPSPGRTDAQRNCVSNIRPAGLSSSEAADTLAYLLISSRRLGLSGVELKDDRALEAAPREDP